MAAMTSAEVGFVPAETLLTVDEKRVVADDGINMNNGEVTRLHIVAPAEFAGWISEKSHLVTLVSAEGATPTGSTAREESEKVAVTMESNRRSKIRLMRKTKQSALEGERIYVKKNTVSGSLELSQETFFLWKKSRLLDQHGVHVSENRQVVRATESFSGGRLLVVGSRALATGVHYWEVKVQAAAWGSVFIG